MKSRPEGQKGTRDAKTQRRGNVAGKRLFSGMF